MANALLFGSLGALVFWSGSNFFRAVHRALRLRESLLTQAINAANDAQHSAESAVATARTAESSVVELQRQVGLISLKLGLTAQPKGH